MGFSICWEAGISISRDWQGGIKLLNGCSGVWLGLMTIVPTIPVMSAVHGVNARLIIEGCTCMLHPVVLNLCSLEQCCFIINPRSFPQHYFQQCCAQSVITDPMSCFTHCVCWEHAPSICVWRHGQSHFSYQPSAYGMSLVPPASSPGWAGTPGSALLL